MTLAHSTVIAILLAQLSAAITVGAYIVSIEKRLVAIETKMDMHLGARADAK